MMQGERQKQAELADELEAAKVDRRIEYRDVVRVVERVVDPTGCDVAPVPASLLETHG